LPEEIKKMNAVRKKILETGTHKQLLRTRFERVKANTLVIDYIVGSAKKGTPQVLTQGINLQDRPS
jgi:hypothetical protein